MVEPIGLTKKFRGLHPKEVDCYLDKLKQNQEEEIKELEKQLEHIREEKDQLYKRVYELQQKWASKSEEKELLDLALLRTKSIAELLLKKAAKDTEELLNEAEKKNVENKKKTIQLEEEIAVTQAQIQTLLNNLNTVFQETERTDKISTKIIQFNDIINEKKTNKDIEKESAAEEKWQEEQPITADGARADDAAKKHNIKENSHQFKKMMDKLARVLTNQEENEKERDENKEDNLKQLENSFWTEKEQKAEKETASAVELDNVLKNVSEEKKTDIPPQTTAGEEVTGADEADRKIEISEIKKEIDNIERRAPEAVKPEKEQKMPESIITSSPAISAEINNIRFKYITGKLAGQDLLDANGKPIITKGEVITSEIVARVETEGKLPELIVNMVLPGMEE